MPVDSVHADYARGLPRVRKMRDFVHGDVSEYVRRLPGHDDADYLLYSEGAYYLPAVSRTIDAFVGMVMNPEPSVMGETPAFKPFLDDTTNDGEPFARVVHRVVGEIVESGRGLMLVDYPDVSGAESMTRLEADAMRLRPYARFYPFEDVINWRVDTINGQKRLTHLRLIEMYDADGDDEWDTDSEPQIRVLDLIEGRYRIRVYREIEEVTINPLTNAKTVETKWVQYGEDRFPVMNNAPMTDIPAVMFGPSSLDPGMVERPPLYEMVGVSESHLADSANRQWAMMWCGNPMYWVGDDALRNDDKAEPIKIGSPELMVLGTGATAGILELGADGVGALKVSMDDKRRDMAAIGARILTDGGSSQISTETARMERAGEHSVLAGIANTVADGMTQVLRLLAEWAGMEADSIEVRLNTDFVPSGLQVGELTEWVNAVQAGELPRSVFLQRLKDRGVVDPMMDETDWADKLAEGGDTLGFDAAGRAIDDQSQSTDI